MGTLLPLLIVAPLAPQQAPGPKSGENNGPTKQAVVGKAIASAPATQDPAYVIGPADMLDISVWKEKELSQTVPVRPDGKISLPLLGDVNAAGLTPMQLAESVMGLLRKYVADPQVTVIVTGMNSQRVFVLGQVSRPGSVALLPNMTILQAISSAGGPNQFADLKAVFLLRTVNGKQTRYPFYYKKVIRGKALDQNLVLRPGDSIIVP